VSPLWRDEIGVYVGPTKVVLARMQRGVRPRCVAEDGQSVPGSPAADWLPALTQLRAMLNEGAWQDANVRVVLSDHWVRYAELPWSPVLANRAERESFARHVIYDTYGTIADDWKVRLSRCVPNQSAIVSAVPAALLQDIDDLFAGYGQRIVSLQPHLLVAFNAWRDRLPAKASWFAVIDEGLLAAMHVSHGRCDRVRSVRISGDWEVEMRRIQKMGQLARGIPAEGPLYVDAPIWIREAASGSNAALEWLEDCGEPANIAHKVSLLKGLYL